ncbi:unnamed protein product [Ostreobium quekettii]|uniref:Uncharacterized protein n=1 Tax=Ostreobium quekettii TaxID=121088 RepID=A0A8S1J3I4_9CHLO|nr:unnamed protein product [Ostreobium quekettii]
MQRSQAALHCSCRPEQPIFSCFKDCISLGRAHFRSSFVNSNGIRNDDKYDDDVSAANSDKSAHITFATDPGLPVLWLLTLCGLYHQCRPKDFALPRSTNAAPSNQVSQAPVR